MNTARFLKYVTSFFNIIHKVINEMISQYVVNLKTP